MDGKERGEKPRKEATEEKAESCQVVIVRNTIGVGLRPHLKLLNFFKLTQSTYMFPGLLSTV